MSIHRADTLCYTFHCWDGTYLPFVAQKVIEYELALRMACYNPDQISVLHAYACC